MGQRNEIEGVLHLDFDEPGTEGCDWAFQDKRFIFPIDWLPPGTPDGPTSLLVSFRKSNGKIGYRPLLLSELPHESWSYEGLYTLEDGDRLTILDKQNPRKIVWKGVIRLKQYESFTEYTSTGKSIHADQVGVSRDVWEKFFIEKYPAKLIPRHKRRVARK